MTLQLCENMSQIGPLHHEIHALKVGQFCTPGCTPGVQVAKGPSGPRTAGLVDADFGAVGPGDFKDLAPPGAPGNGRGTDGAKNGANGSVEGLAFAPGNRVMVRACYHPHPASSFKGLPCLRFGIPTAFARPVALSPTPLCDPSFPVARTGVQRLERSLRQSGALQCR